jgi:aryl-alcohol dehydrogenase-like predicted oxidoreductase
MHTPIEETMRALDDLVTSGKVRYIGVSDTPAWKIAEANVLSHFRGWSSFIGMQMEYSLLERSIEQDLVPLALEFGIGITPWSPLKSGVLSGKYTRKNAGQVKADRGFIIDGIFNEHTYNVIDELEATAKEHNSTPARVALAWVQSRPGVTSTIIGARRMAQLEDNVKALELQLTPNQIERLNNLTQPKFGFPHNMMPMFPSLHNAGTSVNGVYADASPFAVMKGDKAY